MESTTLTTQPDVQASAPTVHVSLSRVGITGVEKVIRIAAGDGHPQLFSAKLECFVDLGPKQKGAHMSRFEEVVNDVIGEVILGETGFKAEQLAERIAVRVRDRQDALRAEVTVAARYPEYKPAPVSGITTQEIYTLFGAAVASARGTRRLIGVTEQEIGGILEAVPVATHDQIGRGTLHLGLPEQCDTDVDAADLLAIVEDSM